MTIFFQLHFAYAQSSNLLMNILSFFLVSNELNPTSKYVRVFIYLWVCAYACVSFFLHFLRSMYLIDIVILLFFWWLVINFRQTTKAKEPTTSTNIVIQTDDNDSRQTNGRTDAELAYNALLIIFMNC